jgi:indolepyruvate ferredoxin oxidoreductase
VIGCDPIVAAETVSRMREGARTWRSTPRHAHGRLRPGPGWQNPAARCAADIARAVGEAGVGSFDADTVAGKLLGDSIYTNPMMLGYAWQKGWVPLTRASLMRAIELNGVQVDNNKAAFEWGRRRARPGASQALASRRAAHRAQAARDAGVDRRAAWSSSPATRTPPTPSSTRPSSTGCGRPRAPWARPA